MNNKEHPGLYIKAKIIPEGMSVKRAAELLGVGRPALSNLLNGNAALSDEMIDRLEKTFHADRAELVNQRAMYEEGHASSKEPSTAPRPYVPTFLKITARDIERWIDGSIEARSLLSVLLRKLAHASGKGLSRVDFPGYDNSQRKGQDGRIEADETTPWIPQGTSLWEFGCNENPERKAENDYNSRTETTAPEERKTTHFVFVTPRNWPGKSEWEKGKAKLGEWKSVRALDASDLEQWLEQSIPAQVWMADQINIPHDGIQGLEDYWQRWKSAATPELVRDIFAPAVDEHRSHVEGWLKKGPSILTVSAASRGEALAFLSCLFDSDGLRQYKDRTVIFSDATDMRKLAVPSSGLIPIVYTDEVERELGNIPATLHTVVFRPLNSLTERPDIRLGLLDEEEFKKALTAMGLDGDRISRLAEESGRSPTVLRRRLAHSRAVARPAWANDEKTTRALIPLMLVGAWNTDFRPDRDIVACLAGAGEYELIERDIAHLLRFEDSPVWSIGRCRGVVSKLDALYAVHDTITRKDLDDFFTCAEYVLSERDPALDLPEDQRWAAGMYDKAREHSGILRTAICETLVLLGVHGNSLFRDRLGMNVEMAVGTLIRKLLSNLTPDKLKSQGKDLPNYAEAAPDTFLDIIEHDLNQEEPIVFSLLEPVNGPFGRNDRTGLMWALETLAWKSERLLRVSRILARLSEKRIEDNWVNKPENSLLSFFKYWIPQTSASVEDRIRVLQSLSQSHPEAAWKICMDQIRSLGSGAAGYNIKPTWQDWANGHGDVVTNQEAWTFIDAVMNLCLSWPEYDEVKLGNLVTHLTDFKPEDRVRIWQKVENWAKNSTDDNKRAYLREKIRIYAFSRQARRKKVAAEEKDRAQEIYDRLASRDPVIRHKWLLSKGWLDEKIDELEDDDFDFRKYERKVDQLRREAVGEIWQAGGIDSILCVLEYSEIGHLIGAYLGEGIADAGSIPMVLKILLPLWENRPAQQMIRGLLWTMKDAAREDLAEKLRAELNEEQFARLLTLLPFTIPTWKYLERLSTSFQEAYWKSVEPQWGQQDVESASIIVENLLKVHRPAAAFFSVHFSWENVSTPLLHKLLFDLATNRNAGPERYQMEAYEISRALQELQRRRPSISLEELAQLEFFYVQALKDTKHGTPNLERRMIESPLLFVQVLAMTYKREDDGEDPPEWRSRDADHKEALFSAGYAILQNMKHIPGTDENGVIDVEALKAWLRNMVSLSEKYGRKSSGQRAAGQLLASCKLKGRDKAWPCEPIRAALEDFASERADRAFYFAVINSRGIHARGPGGDQERELAAQYRGWSRIMRFEYPRAAQVLENVAVHYDHEAVRYDSETAIEDRLRR